MATAAARIASSRPWLLALLAATLSAALLLGGSLGLTLNQARQDEREQMNAQGDRFLVRLEQLFGQLREGLDQLEAQPLRSCGPSMLETLRQVSVSYRFIYEAAFVGGGQACSSWPQRTELNRPRPPDIRGPTYDYWLNTSAQPNDNLAALMLGRGDFRVSTSRGHLTDVVDLPEGGSLLVVLDKGAKAIPVLGPAQLWPPTPDWSSATVGTLVTTATQLIYRMPTQSPEYQLVLITPRTALGQQLSGAWWFLAPASLLVSFCVGILVLQLMRQRQSLGGELQGALRRGELQVLYQPIFDLKSRRCVGAEALVRWRRPDGSLTSPDLFIPLAENTGQIRQITDFVLQQLLEQLGHLLRANPHLYISVNLAACDVMAPRIGRVTARLLAQHRVSPRQIAFEVTERGLIDVVVARNHLQALRDVGHQVLIDDFGTGYCSLAYLQTLPVDCLKIDKAFIDALGHDAASSGVAPHIIRMAHALELRVIAEGIEYEAQAVLLSSEGVSYGQGWLFARPLTAAKLTELVTGGRRTVNRRIDDEA
ncbi:MULTISPECIES: EAL domain-containing protein [unclassified Pseudomonas]|uniref:EAL domain-containing protein n=1 Tax=unclassified Pseudomonas TaxID=196821 RepID=UPI002ACB05B2|nr:MULTISPECIES: EAL domain-containing protein [unclassified Pseudomonas]MEB0039197.1 EAL domain-containing protein [Pseudomonas sp. MH10]MEB0091908.1 EAL domain-containing protein [Pseudomonas sp. CCI4.2]MEB0121066.1 EAL domain-containing protein [Pseudomonas sp. CCI1.2]WPX55063.1 EAL domain-containing protein [Pseudomonas sp. CCI4.2]WPX62508.1 EAL domain-containing protein [Pseudomonas sp. MH10]